MTQKRCQIWTDLQNIVFRLVRLFVLYTTCNIIISWNERTCDRYIHIALGLVSFMCFTLHEYIFHVKSCISKFVRIDQLCGRLFCLPLIIPISPYKLLILQPYVSFLDYLHIKFSYIELLYSLIYVTIHLDDNTSVQRSLFIHLRPDEIMHILCHVRGFHFSVIEVWKCISVYQNTLLHNYHKLISRVLVVIGNQKPDTFFCILQLNTFKEKMYYRRADFVLQNTHIAIR